MVLSQVFVGELFATTEWTRLKVEHAVIQLVENVLALGEDSAFLPAVWCLTFELDLLKHDFDLPRNGNQRQLRLFTAGTL